MLSSTDPNGIVTDHSYGPRGWLTQVAVRATNGTTGSGDVVTGYTYDNVGQLTRLTQPDGAYYGLTWDAAHRLTDIAQYDASNTLYGSLHYTLDAAGQRTREDTKDASGTIKHSLNRTFQAIGELATTLNADNSTVNGTYAFDASGNLNQVTDGLGHVGTRLYDALNRPYQIGQDTGTGGIAAYTQVAFDALDRTTQVTDPQGLATSYQYDGFGDLVQLTSPDTGTTTYTYDPAGNRATAHDARGLTTTYTYDALNRLTAIGYPNTVLNVSIGYDTPESSCLSQQLYAVGRMTHFIDNSGSTQFCFDRFGNQGRKTQAILGPMFVTTDSNFDKMGRPMAMTEPKGTLVYYTRDGLGRITGINYQLSGQSTQTTLIGNVGYLPFGPVSSITYGTGGSARTLNRTYDQDYVISSVKDSGSGGLDLNYSRDILGNLTQVANTGGTSGNNYVYDGLYRLTGQNDLSNNPVAAYTYDGTGNRTSKTVGGVTFNYTYYPSATHQLLNVQGSAGNRSYDADGNTTNNGNGLSFVYDDSERVEQVKAGSTELKQYSYDARGERVRKALTGDPTQTLKTIFDEQGHILGDFDTSNNIIDETIWLDDLPVGVVNNTSGTVNYIEPDHLGTPRAVIDPTRNVAVWKWPLVNDAFGETAPNGDADGDGTAYTLNLRLPGQEWDAESGLSYNMNRYYDSAVGRYGQSDPLGLRGGISTYAYVGANPIARIDPFGLHDPSYGGFYGFPSGNVTDMQIANMQTQPLWDAAREMSGNAQPSDQGVQSWICKALKASPPGSGTDPYNFLNDLRNRSHKYDGDSDLAAAERYFEGYEGNMNGAELWIDMFGKWASAFPPIEWLHRNDSPAMDSGFVNGWGMLGIQVKASGSPENEFAGCGCH